MESPKIPGGYIILSRKIIESEIWDKPPLYIKIWVYLLTKAQHSDYKKLKRGQLFTSIPEIMEACSWKVGFRTEKPTKDQIYQVIDWLRKGNESSHEGDTKATMITTTKATHGLLINIDNYGFYQNPKNYESNEESNDEEETKATRKQRQPDNINKNGFKNGNNEKSSSPKSKIYDETSIYYKLALLLYEEILKNLPDKKKPDLNKWADDFRKLVELDNKKPEHIETVIRFTQSSSFWWKNVLSASKFRDQYERLAAEVREDMKKKKEKVKSNGIDFMELA
jgi:hypothetical protein